MRSARSSISVPDKAVHTRSTSRSSASVASYGNQSVAKSAPSASSDAAKRERKVERFNKKIELVRQREEAYRQIQALSMDSTVTPEGSSYLVSRVLNNISTQTGDAQKRPQEPNYFEIAPGMRRPSTSSISSYSSYARPGSAMSHGSYQSSATSRSSSSVRSVPTRKDFRGMMPMPELDTEEHA